MAIRRCGLRPWSALLVSLAVVLAVAAAFPALAGASATVGQTSDTPTSCSSGETRVWWTSGSGKSLYTVAHPGVITSWTTNPGANTGTSTRLEVIRPGAPITVVGESSIQSNIPAHNTSSFPANIAVQAGDEIALEDVDANNFYCAISASGDAISANTDAGPGHPLGTPTGAPNFRINVAATVTGPPASEVSVPSCPAGGPVTGIVTADSGTTAKTFHYKIDGGAEQAIQTTGNPGTASISIPAGVHSLEYWGEDQLGQQETTHHTVTAGCPIVPIVTPARVSNVGESNSVFAVSPTPKLVTTARKRGPVGTAIKYTLDKPASVRFDFTQAVPGRKVNGKCVAQNKRNKRKHKCTRTVIRGTLDFSGHAGQNSVKFYGWLSKHKKLKPGKYTLVITATSPGVGSTSQKLKFTIIG